MEGCGVSHGALSIVNAVPLGRGASLGVSLTTRVHVRLFSRTDGVSRRDFLGLLAKRVFERIGVRGLDAEIMVETQIPPGVGMKSSSAVANALILALLDALGVRLENAETLELNATVSKEAGVSFTGAFDDAAACLLGGIQVTDNTRRIILKSYAAKEEKAVFLVPKEAGRKNLRVNLSLRESLKTAFSLALRGRYLDAMNLNGTAFAIAQEYALEPLIAARRAGADACGITGNGPAYAALVGDKGVHEVLKAWSGFGQVIVADVYNAGD
jgi:shikimate kinase